MFLCIWQLTILINILILIVCQMSNTIILILFNWINIIKHTLIIIIYNVIMYMLFIMLCIIFIHIFIFVNVLIFLTQLFK